MRYLSERGIDPRVARLAVLIVVLIVLVVITMRPRLPDVGAILGPGPTAQPLPAAELKYRLRTEIGEILYCDPDQYPIAEGNEPQKAAEALPRIERDEPETYRVILEHVGVGAGAEPTPDDVLAIYREWKLLTSIALTPQDDGMAFDILVSDDSGAGQGHEVEGRITQYGVIQVDRTGSESIGPNCPLGPVGQGVPGGSSSASTVPLTVRPG